MRTVLTSMLLSLSLLAVHAADVAPGIPRTGGGRHEAWYERMSRRLDQKVSLEFEGEGLAAACTVLADLTGLTIIVDPKIAKAEPKVSFRVQDMSAGNCLKWMTRLTETHAQLVDQAIFITDKPAKEEDDAERLGIILLAARLRAEIELPPEGTPLTDEDRVKIALKLSEKDEVKLTDFPAPEVGLGLGDSHNPFQIK